MISSITELRYSNTNTYLITGSLGTLLFDTGWAGTFPAFRDLLAQHKRKVTEIDSIMISHFHPDHMGLSQEIADLANAKIIVLDVQQAHIHDSDIIFEKENNKAFVPIRDESLTVISEEAHPGVGLQGILDRLDIKGK